jgi:GTP-binding protein
MLPTLVLVGRPNVGKSTLFNRLTASRAALVADYPGLTRDRHYGRGRWGERPYLVVDTGGFEPKARDGIMQAMAAQTKTAIAEADAIIFLVDGRAGLTGEDITIAEVLRRTGRPVLLAVNKSEGLAPERATAEFHELALGTPLPISSAHGENLRELVEHALAQCPPQSASEAKPPAAEEKRIKVAIVGRPNVGKSTLVNTLLGEERVITFDQPGTTRDSIYLDFDHGGRSYTLIDTAGVRRRGKVTETIEKFSVIKTLQAIEDANVVVLLLDAEQGVSEQDAHLAGHILEAGRALVVAVNKWDAADADARAQIKRELERKLGFHRRAHRGGRPGLCRGDGAAAHAEAHPGAAGGARAPAAPPGGTRAAKASLRAPGRGEPAAHRHPRQRAVQRSGRVPPLPGTFLPRGVPTAGNAA